MKMPPIDWGSVSVDAAGNRVPDEAALWAIHNDPHTECPKVLIVNTPKQVNQNWSINMIQQAAPIAVADRIAVCEGGPSEALGHPTIYINLVNIFN